MTSDQHERDGEGAPHVPDHLAGRVRGIGRDRRDKENRFHTDDERRPDALIRESGDLLGQREP
jgi:hypothetical protein